MTVSYQYDVASSASGGFIRLLFRWKGSVWKVVYQEMAIFTVCYVLLTVLYQFALTESQQKIFEKVVYFCSTFMDLIPLSFMLGFYVSFIAARWWSQFIAIPWPDKLMNIVAMYIPGLDESSRVVRRTLMRYLNLSLVLVLRSISMAVKRRFPTKEHLIEAGFMTKTELEMFQSVPSTEFNTFWIPCTWFINVLREARQECRITDSNGLKLIMEELNEFRSKCGLLWGYDWISIPLVYTQVVTMATYAFFVACMFGRQNVNTQVTSTHRYDYYIPIFTILQLMFYMGLLKVAEQLINPFGDDDEDFELNWIIDRHMKVSYLGVDTLNGTPPPLVKDTYYDELDVKIPYTEASKSYKKKTYRGSVAYMQVPMEGQGMVLPDMSEEEDDGETVSESMGPRRPSIYTLFQSRTSNCKISPASSYTNLDNRSIASLDSEWKCSLPNIAAATKNASGTLGPSEAPTLVVEMAKAEDDEMVLQEVIIEPDAVPRHSVCRSDSLQIPGKQPGVAKDKKSLSMLSMLRDLSPKIAPKFPREKLKSMFRKSKKISAAFPFYKLKGVHFTRQQKREGSINQSLLDVTYQDPVDLEITLSTPELTEIEKETGVHPYYFTQQTISSAKELVTGRAFSVRQPNLIPRYGSQENKLEPKCTDPVSRFVSRSNSLPNIRQAEEMAAYIQDPIIGSTLKKISTAMSGKKASIQPKKKKRKKSPPPDSTEDQLQKDDHKHLEKDKDKSVKKPESESLDSRRNTLPQITLTRCGRDPINLELTTPAVSQGHSSSPSSESPSTVKQLPKKKSSSEPRRSSIQRRTSEPMKPYSASIKGGSTRRDSKSHSTKPALPSKPSVKIAIAEEDVPKISTFSKRSPPPKRPDSRFFSGSASPSRQPGLFPKSSSEISSDDIEIESTLPGKTRITRSPSFPSKVTEQKDRSAKLKRSSTISQDSTTPKQDFPAVILDKQKSSTKSEIPKIKSGPSLPTAEEPSATKMSHGSRTSTAMPTAKRELSVADTMSSQVPKSDTDSVVSIPTKKLQTSTKTDQTVRTKSDSTFLRKDIDTSLTDPSHHVPKPRDSTAAKHDIQSPITDSTILSPDGSTSVTDVPKPKESSTKQDKQSTKAETPTTSTQVAEPSRRSSIKQEGQIPSDSFVINIPECVSPTTDPSIPRFQRESTVVTMPDLDRSPEIQRIDQVDRPPEIPQRHVPRSSSRGKK